MEELPKSRRVPQWTWQDRPGEERSWQQWCRRGSGRGRSNSPLPRYLQLSKMDEQMCIFLIEVEDAVQRHLNMKLSDLNRKAGSKCDICAGTLCNSSRAQWMCDALQALQYLGPLADPRFADRKSHSDVGRAVLGPPGLIGPQMGQQRLVHLRYRSERSTNPDHKKWTNSVAVSFPLCNQRKDFFFNCTEYYALAALLQLRTMMRSCAYLREAARTLTLQEMPWRAPQSALAQAAHAQASAATATPPPPPTPPPPRPQRFRLRNRRCTARPPTLQLQWKFTTYSREMAARCRSEDDNDDNDDDDDDGRDLDGDDYEDDDDYDGADDDDDAQQICDHDVVPPADSRSSRQSSSVTSP